MPSVIHAEEFFVVGGPVEPAQPCYVLRAADTALAAAIREGGLCCVLGAPAVGKTSLLLRAAQASRAAGARVAYVSLAASGAADGDGSLGAEQVAAGIAAALGVDVDVAAWWSEGEPTLGEPRLVAFFADIVLPRVPQRVLVLLDDVEALLDRPAGLELLDGIVACQLRRAHDATFARLAFVLAGRAALRQLFGGGAPDAATAGVAVVEPADFSLVEAYRLAAAFGGEPAQAHALMDRIHSWTGGHPYLTQKIARGVARKGGRLEDVERVIRAEVLSPDAAGTDAALAPLRARLRADTRPARRAVKIARRLGSTAAVRAPTDAEVADELRLAGATATDGGRVTARNRIVKELAAAGWLKPAGRGVALAAAAALVVAVLVGAGYWYVWQLPAADIAALESSATAPAAVEAAYRRLRALPGFAERADALWLAALLRQAGAAESLEAALAVDARLRALPGREAAADALLGEFWRRQSRGARFAERRDAALLFAQRAARSSAAEPSAAFELAELIGSDYPLLQSSESVEIAAAAATPAMTALQYAALEREFAVDGEGRAGDFELTVTVNHPATGELRFTLTAPNGVAATFSPPAVAGEAGESFLFQAVEGAPLAELASSRRAGVWRLTVVDREPGNAGSLAAWGIVFSETGPRDRPAEPVAIPDPARTTAVNVATAGERAVAWAAEPGPLGAVALWNTATGVLERDLLLPGAVRHAGLDATGTRVLAATDRALVLFDAASGEVAGRIGTQTEFVLPAVFSTDGDYVAIAERVDRAPPLFSVLRAADASFVASFEGANDVERWELGPGARYAALLGPANVVRIVSTRGGEVLARLVHEADVARLVHLPDGVLVTADADARIASWPLTVAGAPARSLGRAAALASVSIAAPAGRVAYTRLDGSVAIVDARSGAEIVRLLERRASPPLVPELAADGVELVTRAADRRRRWTLPSAAPPVAAAPASATALALGRDGAFALLGLASGQAEFGAAAGRPGSLAFFGHRGAVTTAAVREEVGVAATGGVDGFVRLWEVSTGEPTGVVVQSAREPISIVALSPDGRYVASAAGSRVRVASTADGVVRAELEAAAQVTALALGPEHVAFGDRSGLVALARLGVDGARTVQLAAAVGAVAFSRDAAQLVAGCADGRLVVLATADGGETAAGSVPAPVRWADFSPGGGQLLVATDTWLHALERSPTLAPVASRLVTYPARQVALAAAGETLVRVAGLDAAGALVRAEIDLAAVPAGPPAPEHLERDWSAVLGLRLDAAGLPVPLGP